MEDGRNIIGELSLEDQAIITREYGPQACFGSRIVSRTPVASIHALTPEEQTFFGQSGSDSAHFSVQRLFKFHGTFVPVRFTKELQRLAQDNPILRPAIAG